MEFARIVRRCVLVVLFVGIGGAGLYVAAVDARGTTVRSPANGTAEDVSPWERVHPIGAATDVPDNSVPIASRASGESWTFWHVAVAAGFLGGVILLLLGFVVLRCRVRDRKRMPVQEDGGRRATGSWPAGQSLADLGHELRTPMNSILGMIGLALQTSHEDERSEYLRIAKQSAESLMEFIDDIEDLSTLSGGTIELDAVDFSLRKNLSEILNVLAIRAHRKGLQLACRVEPEVPDRLIGDPGRLRQVLINLIDNAIKFTEEGEVVVDVERFPGAANTVSLHFVVSDTGIGIPENQQPLIFEKFGRLDNAVTQEQEGTGLGLNIASRLVQRMGGKLEVASTVDEGSTFYFTIDLPFGDDRHSELPALSESIEGRRVLLVEPDDTSRVISREILENGGLEVVATKKTTDAVRQLSRAASTDPFDLVFVDARMATPDNAALYSVLTELQQISNTSVVLLSHAGEHEVPHRSHDLTGTAFMMKPVTEYEVAMLLYEIYEGRTGGTCSSGETFNPARDHPLRILVAEDDVVNQQLAVEILNKHDHKVEVVQNGEEAVAAHASGRYDLIFMDVHMPKVDGLEATRIIRARERQMDWTTPIVGITARATDGDRRVCLEAGMDGYIAKPIVPEQLVRSIERIMSECRGAVPGGSDIGRSSDDGAVSADDIRILNREKLKLVFGEDDDYLKQFMELFLEICPRYMADVEEAVHDRDHERLALSAHRLHSSLESLHAEVACQVVARLERAARSRDLEDAPEIFERLKREIERLKRVLLDETVM